MRGEGVRGWRGGYPREMIFCRAYILQNLICVKIKTYWSVCYRRVLTEMGEVLTEMGEGTYRDGEGTYRDGGGYLQRWGRVLTEMGEGGYLQRWGRVLTEMERVLTEMGEGVLTEMGEVLTEMGEVLTEMGEVLTEMGEGTYRDGGEYFTNPDAAVVQTGCPLSCQISQAMTIVTYTTLEQREKGRQFK